MKLTCCSFYIHVYVIVSQLPRLHIWGDIVCIRTVLLIPQRITWHVLGSQPPQTVSRLNNHMTVHLQSKVIIWSCGKNTRAVLVPGLTWSPYPRLISKHWKGWWTGNWHKKNLKWNIEWVNLDIRACNKMLVWAADKLFVFFVYILMFIHLWRRDTAIMLSVSKNDYNRYCI